MGKVNHSDDSINHRVSDGNEGVSASDRQPVYKLLKEIQEVLHGFWNSLNARSLLNFAPGTENPAGGGKKLDSQEKHLLPGHGEKVLFGLPLVNGSGLVYRSFAAV
ncbi:Dyp-type peroxidase [Marinobacter sp. F4216]|uniref:Dyp-type peroxidase n=1 Tax=Marinobacter sp. F4216 TaxID=2874281 RepID=UPI001CBE0820|nr:Dyp-type peroxidase [Marinobacter sp. F4216]